jgi:hypothetical protein
MKEFKQVHIIKYSNDNYYFCKKYMLMLKRLSITLLISFCTMLSSAQIQRNILGCNLGTSSKNAVVNTLKKKGVRYDNTSSTQLCAYNVQFGGISWSFVFFNFYGNKLYQVAFMCSSSESTSEHLSISHNRVSGILQRKYKKYYSAEFSDASNISYEDKTTGVDLYYGTNSNGLLILSLDYKYYPLFDKLGQSQEDDF